MCLCFSVIVYKLCKLCAWLSLYNYLHISYVNLKLGTTISNNISYSDCVFLDHLPFPFEEAMMQSVRLYTFFSSRKMDSYLTSYGYRRRPQVSQHRPCALFTLSASHLCSLPCLLFGCPESCFPYEIVGSTGAA